ncbi:DUF6454 family protein [Pendulispora rubella]|uniref:DUF6454 family protein n=1 Tax=Pendulispora rubella TaxID=2741070 RepID=A0ABZ2L137_9BACT
MRAIRWSSPYITRKASRAWATGSCCPAWKSWRTSTAREDSCTRQPGDRANFSPSIRTESVANASHFFDGQSCITVGAGGMICAGVAEYPIGPDKVFSMGGLSVVDTATGYVRHEVPIATLSPAGRTVTYNAVHLDVVSGKRLRMLAVPDDGEKPGESNLLVLETTLRR